MVLITSRLLLSALLLLTHLAVPQHTDDLVIPTSQSPLVLDGQCNDFDETLGIAWQTNSQTRTVSIAYTRDHLLVCVQAPVGKLYERWIGVYLDPQFDAGPDTLAQPNDWTLQINLDLGKISSQTGNGTGGYTAATTLWHGQRTHSADTESAEFQIPLYGLHLGECGRSFRIAVAHQWVNAVGEDYFWPTGANYNHPATWATANLTGTTALCPDQLTQRQYVPMFIFNGLASP